jgi:hypothetical protein
MQASNAWASAIADDLEPSIRFNLELKIELTEADALA